MCGIMGYYSFGKALPKKEKIEKMFSLLETRGHDASGFAFLNNEGNLSVHKAPVRSSQMVKTDEWKNLSLPKVMIFHTRLKTQGTEKNNMNNHPLFSKQGVCIVHNGIIYNDKEIFGKRERDGEVDSEAILSVLSLKGKGDKVKRLFDRLEGAFAVAVISTEEPDKLTLIKKDNPVELYLDTKEDILYFCSERNIMQEGLEIKGHSKRGFNLGEDPYHYYEMANNHGLVLGKDGVESYRRYFPRRTSSWLSRTYSYPDTAEEMIIECPWCFSKTRYYEGKLFNKCNNCGLEINEEDLYNAL